MNDDEIYFFYKGIPYKKDKFSNEESKISGTSIWDNSWSFTINKSDIIFCKEDEIDKIFINNCKNAIKQSLIGWTPERAKELEERGKEYLTKKWKKYLLDCPNRVYEACQEGKYGIIYECSSIELPDEFKMGNKPCSDGKVRSEKEYMKYLLGEDWCFIRLFMIKWPMLKFKYVDLSTAEEPFPDIYCMVPFYNDPVILNEIQTSLLI